MQTKSLIIGTNISKANRRKKKWNREIEFVIEITKRQKDKEDKAVEANRVEITKKKKDSEERNERNDKD